MTRTALTGPGWGARLPYLRSLAARWTQLVVGLFGFGVSIALMVRSGLGLGPWDAFHVGLHLQTGISIGMATVLAGVVVLAISYFLGVRPGVGTLVNMLGIGAFIDLLVPWIPTAPHWGWGIAYYAAAVALAGLSTGMYIAPALGKGPRDGLVIGIGERTGWPLRRVRTLTEMSALALGWAMGGSIGIGTVIFTLTIGPSMQWGLQLFGALPPLSGEAAEEAVAARRAA